MKTAWISKVSKLHGAFEERISWYVLIQASLTYQRSKDSLSLHAKALSEYEADVNLACECEYR